jgi:WD40 repeat protein/energy-coupling factor transporter ATP-binding protein EcfA2
MSERNPFPGLRPFEFDEHELFFGREEQYEQMVGKLSEMRFLAVVGTSGSGKSSLVKAGLLPALYGGMMSAGPDWRVALFRPKEDPIRELALALNHRRVFGDRSKENGSSQFKMTEAIDWQSLCSRLSAEAREESHNPGGRVLEILPVEKRDVILKVARGRTVEEGKSDFVQTFNEVLKKRNFYKARDFERIQIKGDAKVLLSRGQNNLSDLEIEKLNRLILEAAYPQEIAKNGEIQAQITEVTLRRGDLGLVEAAREANMSAGENLLVVVDQFEELFRYARISEMGPHGNQAAAFVKLLLAARSQREIPIYVVLTMRSDYLGDCAAFWDLPEAINEGQYLIPRLTRDQRREAIRGPIKVRGADITPQLVNKLLNDMGDNPDQLPILQHALMRTWDNWEKDKSENEPISTRHYEAIGTMAEALSRHADEAFADLKTKRNQEIAERLFKCLTEKGAGDRETRRPTELRDIRAITGGKIKEIVGVIDVFRQEDRSFLMPPSKKPLKRETLIDISHESLIRNWRKLSEWVEQEARSANIYRRLVETARLHKEDRAGLLTPLEVDYALKWLETEKPNAVWASRYHCNQEVIEKSHAEAPSGKPRKVRDKEIFNGALAFLEASRQSSVKAKEEQKKRRRRQLRRTRLIAAVFIFASVFCAIYWNQARKEKELSKLLIYAENINSARSEFDRGDYARMYRLLGTLATRDYDELRGFEWYFSTRPDKSLKYKLGPKKGQSESAVLSIAFIPDRHRLVYAWADGTVTLRDTNSGAEIGDYELAEPPSKVVFSPDGSVLATVDSTQKEAKLWDMTDGHKLGDLKEFDPAEATNGEPSQTYESKTNVQSLAISPDAKFFVLTREARDEKNPESSKNTIEVWDSRTFELVKRLPEMSSRAFLAMAVSIDGILAIGCSDGSVDLWELDTLQQLEPLQKVNRNNAALLGVDPFSKSVTTLAFSPDGRTLASGRVDGSINLWNVGARKEVNTFTAHPKSISSMAFSRDGKVLASASDNGSVKVWQTDCLLVHSLNDAAKECPEQATLTGHSDSILSVAFISENYLATASADNTVGLWDTNAKSDTSYTCFSGPLDQTSFIKFSPDGKVLGTVSQAGLVRFWDTATMQEKSLQAREGKASMDIASLAFSSTGKMLATWNPAGSITLWDTNTWTERGKLEGAPTSANGKEFLMAFSIRGDRLATWSQKDGVTIYDTKIKLTKLSTLPLPPGNTFSVVAFSPDLSTLAAGISNGDVQLFDTRTGKPRKQLEAHSGPVLSIAFSNDGRRLATGYADNTVKIWNTSSSEQPATLRGHTAPVQALAFSDDGTRLATGSWDASVKIWDTDINHWDMNVELWDRTKNRQELLTLQENRQEDPILSVSFSPDGKTLAAARANNRIKLW